MRRNLQTIIETSTDSGAAVVLLGIKIPPNYGQRYIEEFESVFRELATELEVPWIEFFMEGVALNEELMQDDLPSCRRPRTARYAICSSIPSAPIRSGRHLPTWERP